MDTNQLEDFVSLSKQEKNLVDTALEYAGKAYAPYSQFPVGAAVLGLNASKEEKIFGGFNVENASFGGCICAERTAIISSVLAGYSTIKTVAVVCLKQLGGSPCGICRQFIREFGHHSEVLIISNTNKSIKRTNLQELLPDSFGPEALQQPT